jgi:hypothetical protein
MIHGFILQGTSGKNHYGAASVGSPDDIDLEACRKMGERLGNLVIKTSS